MCMLRLRVPTLSYSARSRRRRRRRKWVNREKITMFVSPPSLSSNPDGDDAASSFGSWHWEGRGGGGNAMLPGKKEEEKGKQSRLLLLVGTRHEIIPQYPI